MSLEKFLGPLYIDLEQLFENVDQKKGKGIQKNKHFIIAICGEWGMNLTTLDRIRHDQQQGI
jgi:hypothetical protein